MKKFILFLLVLFLLVFISVKVSAQVYQEMPQYGYRANRMAFDSTLQIPTVCGVPTLKSIVKTNKNGAIAYDSCNARFYTYNPKTLTWTAITGGGSTDTTSLSNRINLKIDSLKRSNDSVYAYRNGTRVFQFKDSVGGGNFWNTSGFTSLTNDVQIRSDNSIQFAGIDDELQTFAISSVDFNYSLQGGTYKIEGLTQQSDTSIYKPLVIGTDNSIKKFPYWVSGGGGVAVDTIFRTLGKDSIFYKKNNITYAIKDSVGTNPAPVGYYGAFQDTTTQTAVSINTAYGVKLGVTDLSNGVTISNNTRIKIANAGIYNIQFSLQLEKTGSGNMIADIWLRKNGVNLAGTTGKVVLTGSANASPVIAAWNYVIAVASGDSLELMWATSNDNVVIKATAATSPHPSIPSAILTVTQQSGIMAGTGISPLDTANMLSNYARTNLVNTKLNISDTSALQPKSISSYSILANNTNATSNATAQYFKDTSGTYTGTITWNGTAPTSGNLTYRWTRIGKMVTINISLVYANAGSSNTSITIPLPSDAPTPTKPSGLTSASNLLYPCYGGVNATNQTTLSNSSFRGFLRNNSSNNGFEFFVNHGTTTPINAFVTCTYFTD